ncbi:MAG TPA: NifU family protein [Pseudonocardiaceae bacterium]|jgi:Fe-S cluster biogenesis protein NfuA/nitrite reductase/ring-hydroxylating ferredoxin subunit|nr:NifU family protein [Pseudonocardiaceae bacterium]
MRKTQTVGDRIEELLGGLSAGRDREAAEELVSLLVEMYGTGLGRVVALLADRAPALLRDLADDELVENLFLLHDLHPLDVDARIQRALDRVRPYLGSHAGGVEYLGVDEQGIAQLRLEGNCDGCPSSTLTVKMAIEGALQDAAPEIAGVEVAGVTPPPSPSSSTLLQIGTAPPAGWYAGAEPDGDDRGWHPLPDLGPPTLRPVRLEIDGVPVLVCSVRGTLYAYRDACAACGSTLGKSVLDGEVLACSACGSGFNVRLAGRGVDDNTRHLDPLPLLSDSQGVRVAVPRTVPS